MKTEANGARPFYLPLSGDPWKGKEAKEGFEVTSGARTRGISLTSTAHYLCQSLLH